MEPHQTSTIVTKTSKLQLDSSEKKISFDENLGVYSGILDVHIHQARNIHNICIYQNQDVYAKLWLTSDPEQKVSTQVINGGGKNPVFDENVQFSVRTINSMLRCEVWMLSRIKNYLEDQLLGLTVVPLSDILIDKGKLSREFSLSSSDLFHSPAGFVQLTLTYYGASPEVMEIPRPTLNSGVNHVVDKDSGVNDAALNQLRRIEFADLNIVDENEFMASEYFAIPCPHSDTESADHCGSAGSGVQTSLHSHICNPETVDAHDEVASVTEVPLQTPSLTAIRSSASVSVPLDTPSASSDASESKKRNDVSNSKAGTASEVEESVKSVLRDKPSSSFTWPVITETIKSDQNVVQQEIIGKYMKSMNQFTEALAKMKLPMDMENGSSTQNAAGNSVKSGCSEKPNASKDMEPSTKVYYGSRAFF